MKLSARNVLKGKVGKIVKGSVNSEVTIELPEDERLVSIITNTSVVTLSLKKGMAAYAVIQSIKCHGCRGRINTVNISIRLYSAYLFASG